MKSFIYLSMATLLLSLVALGQTNGFGTTALSADLSPENLVPPIEARAESGLAEVEITLVDGGATASDSAMVTYEVTIENAEEGIFTGFAIHEGATGLNGSVVVEAQLDTAEPPTGNGFSGQMMITGSTQLDALRDIIANPGGYYVLVTAQGFPSGLLRGQLTTGDGGNDVDTLTDKVDNIQEQLDTIQVMVRRIGRVLGIAPELLPMPEGADSSNNGNSSN